MGSTWDAQALRSPSAILARFEAALVAHPFLVAVLLDAIALSLRLRYLLEFHHSPIARAPLMDEAFYRAEAWNLIRGVPPVSDAYFMTPLYPWFLSLIFRVAGDGPVAPFAVQMALGALAAPLTWILGRRALRPVWALAAALAIAAFAPLVFFEALYLVEGLVLLALTVSFAVAVVAPHRHLAAWFAGLALGVAVLGRGSNLLLALPLGIWVLARGGPERRRALVRAGVFALGIAIALAPLLVRNTLRTGRPFLLTANAGFNLYVGNGPDATGIFATVPDLDLQQDLFTLRYVQRRVHRPVTASETNDFWMQRTFAWIREHPARTLRLFGWKLLLFWNRVSIPQIEGFDAAAQGTVLARPPFWRSFAFLPLALMATLLALIDGIRRWRAGKWDERAATRALLAASAVVYALSIAVFFVTDRYRVPILPVLFVLAATAVEMSAGMLRFERRRWIPALALVLTTCFVATDPGWLGVDERHMRRDLKVHAALRDAADGRFDAAVGTYREAVALDPGDAETREGLARMLARAGRDSLAVAAYRDLLSERPDFARAWYNLGNLYHRTKQPARAIAAYERALALDPDREAAWNQLGEVYRIAGDTARAASCYRQALAIVPAYDRALNNLAALRAFQGDAADAEAGWRAALAVNPRYLPALVNLAILLTNSGRHAEALATWRTVLSVDPGNAAARQVIRELDPDASLPERPASIRPDSEVEP